MRTLAIQLAVMVGAMIIAETVMMMTSEMESAPMNARSVVIVINALESRLIPARSSARLRIYSHRSWCSSIVISIVVDAWMSSGIVRLIVCNVNHVLSAGANIHQISAL